MPRIRTIKPEFWRSPSMASVSEAACLLAIGLLNMSDDEGYFDAHPGIIKADVFPLRDPSVTIHGLISELSCIGYIEVFFGTDGREYGRVKNFTEHQVINRPKPSKIKGLIAITDESVIDHGSITAGREGKGREQGTGNREQGMERALDDVFISCPDAIESVPVDPGQYRTNRFDLSLCRTRSSLLAYLARLTNVPPKQAESLKIAVMAATKTEGWEPSEIHEIIESTLGGIAHDRQSKFRPFADILRAVDSPLRPIIPDAAGAGAPVIP